MPAPCENRPGRNRTCNPRFWRPVLYQLSYGPSASRASRHPAIASVPGWLTGLEPATSGATVRRSNRLSYNHHEVVLSPPSRKPHKLVWRERFGQACGPLGPARAGRRRAHDNRPFHASRRLRDFTADDPRPDLVLRAGAARNPHSARNLPPSPPFAWSRDGRRHFARTLLLEHRHPERVPGRFW